MIFGNLPTDLPLINCKIELDLSWLEDFIISQISRRSVVVANPNANLPVQVKAATQTTGATPQITNVKLYVPIVTLSVNANIKFLENIKQGFKRTVSWNKYSSEMT